MIKLLATGLWACLVTLGATFGVLEWQKHAAPAGAAGEGEKKLEELRTKAINVPIIGNGIIQGYMVAQFVFTVDSSVLHKVPINPEVYVLDEAFKTIYSGEQINFQNMKKQDLSDKSILLGSPQQIVDTLKKVEAAGIEEVILYFNVGCKPHNLVKEQMHRFIEQVAPHFKGKHNERRLAKAAE